MKKLTFFILLVGLAVASKAQSVKFGIKNDAPIIETSKVEIRKDAVNKVYLQMTYGGWEIKNPEDYEPVKGQTIESIQLVYSNFPEDEDFTELNNKRIASLYILDPYIFSQKFIEWQVIRQNDCKSSWEASQMFHGFVITYRPAGSTAFAKMESSYLSTYVADETSPKPDSTIFKVFERNKSWKDMLVVCDLTGSMSPYVSQLLLWLKLTFDDDKVKYLTFFNDGDNKRDSEKKIGKTGGLYFNEVSNFDSCLSMASRVILNGSGGDTPENNLEALEASLKKWDDYKEVVMIADNYATPRDMSLLKEIKKPVKVILCGTGAGVNTAYLQIAYETGGSIHTMEEDLTDLIKMHEGSKVKIGKQEFVIQRGKFVLIRSS